MENKQFIDVEKALAEKRAMQERFILENGHSSSVLALIITHFEGMKEK